jgi:hypothetical protein
MQLSWIPKKVKLTFSNTIDASSGYKNIVNDTGIGIMKIIYVNKSSVPFSQEVRGYTRSFDGNGSGV